MGGLGIKVLGFSVRVYFGFEDELGFREPGYQTPYHEKEHCSTASRKPLKP